MRTLTAIALSAVLAAATPALHANAFAMPQSGKQQQVKLIKGTWWGSVGDRVEVVVKDQLATRTMTGTVTKIDSDKGILTMDVETDGKKSSRPIFTSTIVSINPAGGAAAPATTGAAPKTSSDAAPVTDGKPAPSTAVPTGKPSGKVDAQATNLMRTATASPRRRACLCFRLSEG